MIEEQSAAGDFMHARSYVESLRDLDGDYVAFHERIEATGEK